MLSDQKMKVAIIGGGASGFFAAIAVRENHPNAAVTIFEKSQKLLAKVKISGGGRCNVTNGCTDIQALSEAYPRGNRFLRKAFGVFHTQHAMQWFEERGVPLVIQDDNCVFPRSQNSQSIIDCFLSEAQRLNIAILQGSGIHALIPCKNGIELALTSGETRFFHKVIIATGGSPKEEGLNWLKEIGQPVVPPVPSLFTFNMPNESIRSLMGVVVENAIASIPGTKLKSEGPLLITHWGMSGPAILKLSAFGARILSDSNYQFTVSINWVHETHHDRVKETLQHIQHEHAGKQVSNYRPFKIPERLWQYLLEKLEIDSRTTWKQLGSKTLHKITEKLVNDCYQVQGKTTFKEEFVTCGGVDLAGIDVKTMQSKCIPDLYFAGEVMDIDGITGGYNFQAAWTTAYIAGKLN